MAKKKSQKIEETRIEVNDRNEKEAVNEVSQDTVVKTEEFQMKIHEMKVVKLEGVSKVVIKNVFGGDLFVYTDEEKRLYPGEEMVIKDIDEVILRSFSRPFVRVEYYR